MKIKEWLYPAIIVSVIVLGIMLVGFFAGNTILPDEPEQTITLGGGVSTAKDMITTATSSVYYLADGTATTTWVFDIVGATSIDLNLIYNASTTDSQLVWYYEFSTATSTGDEGYGDEMYGEDVKSVSGSNITHGAGLTLHKWTPGTTGLNFRNISVDPVASKYIRVSFHTWGGNGAFWAEAILNKPY